MSDQRLMFLDTDLLWCVLPSEAAALLQGKMALPLLETPVFTPRVYTKHGPHKSKSNTGKLGYNQRKSACLHESPGLGI